MPPFLQHSQQKKTWLLHTMQMAPSRLQLPPPVASLPAMKVPAGGASDSLRTQRGRPVHTTADPLMLMHEHEHEEVLNVDRTTRKCCRGRRRRPRQLQRRCPQELDAQLLPQEVQRIAALHARCLAYLCVHPQPLVLAAFDRISTVTDRCSHLRTTPPYTRGLVLRSSLALICLDMSRIICLVSCPTTCVNIRRKRR